MVVWFAATVLGTTAYAEVGRTPDGRSPTEWLQSMDGAFRTLDYDGVFSYYAANPAQHVQVDDEISPAGDNVVTLRSGYRATTELATFRVVHMVIDDVERERIVHLNGPVREILRTGDEVAYMLRPGDELLDLEGAIPNSDYPRAFARRFEDIADHYDVTASDGDRVAGRAAIRVHVAPRDADRLGYRLWLDEETGLLLCSELRDPSRAYLEIFQFTSLQVGDDVDAKDLEAATDGPLVRHVAPATATDTRAEPTWQAGWVPAGFELTSANIDHRSDDARDVSMLTFSDGMTAFSVFVEAMPEVGAGRVVSRSGATVALTHLAASEGGDHLVTVVGEVPVGTARRIAASVDRKP